MGKIALSLKINLSKMDMARIFNGKEGAQYLDATIFVNMDELDQYGNSGMITQDVTKDEKAQGIKGNILGNGKVFWVENGQAPQQPGQAGQGFQQQPAPQQNTGGFQQAPQQPQAQQGGFSNQSPAQQQGPYNAPQQQAGGFMPQNQQ
jgi:hypothetical protein